MTTENLNLTASQDVLAVSATKRVWVKPIVEIISVESGVNHRFPEADSPPMYAS